MARVTAVARSNYDVTNSTVYLLPSILGFSWHFTLDNGVRIVSGKYGEIPFYRPYRCGLAVS